jgi:hypothetical protein
VQGTGFFRVEMVSSLDAKNKMVTSWLTQGGRELKRALLCLWKGLRAAVGLQETTQHTRVDKSNEKENKQQVASTTLIFQVTDNPQLGQI